MRCQVGRQLAWEAHVGDGRALRDDKRIGGGKRVGEVGLADRRDETDVGQPVGQVLQNSALVAIANEDELDGIGLLGGKAGSVHHVFQSLFEPHIASMHRDEGPGGSSS